MCSRNWKGLQALGSAFLQRLHLPDFQGDQALGHRPFKILLSSCCAQSAIDVLGLEGSRHIGLDWLCIQTSMLSTHRLPMMGDAPLLAPSWAGPAQGSPMVCSLGSRSVGPHKQKRRCNGHRRREARRSVLTSASYSSNGFGAVGAPCLGSTIFQLRNICNLNGGGNRVDSPSSKTPSCELHLPPGC